MLKFEDLLSRTGIELAELGCRLSDADVFDWVDQNFDLARVTRVRALYQPARAVWAVEFPGLRTEGNEFADQIAPFSALHWSWSKTEALAACLEYVDAELQQPTEILASDCELLFKRGPEVVARMHTPRLNASEPAARYFRLLKGVSVHEKKLLLKRISELPGVRTYPEWLSTEKTASKLGLPVVCTPNNLAQYLRRFIAEQGTEPKLSAVQAALARILGFRSWHHVKHVESLNVAPTPCVMALGETEPRLWFGSPTDALGELSAWAQRFASDGGGPVYLTAYADRAHDLALFLSRRTLKQECLLLSPTECRPPNLVSIYTPDDLSDTVADVYLEASKQLLASSSCLPAAISEFLGVHLPLSERWSGWAARQGLQSLTRIGPYMLARYRFQEGPNGIAFRIERLTTEGTRDAAHRPGYQAASHFYGISDLHGGRWPVLVPHYKTDVFREPCLSLRVDGSVRIVFQDLTGAQQEEVIRFLKKPGHMRTPRY